MESLSLAVTFLLSMIVYEFLKPKSDHNSDGTSHDDTDEDEGS
ncbi:hypothetical protein [Sulfuricurvum sp.]|jgi:hypothetical protein|nr:hypothetical protein [Sulfuricurvum sp.]